MKKLDAEDEDVRQATGIFDTWTKLGNESKNVTVRNLTFVEPVEDRNMQHVLPAIARIISHLCTAEIFGMSGVSCPLWQGQRICVKTNKKLVP